MRTAAQNTVKNQNKKTDRFGRALVSFILSFIGLASLALFYMVRIANSISHYNTGQTGILTLTINGISFFLGISARNSTSGRGLAIAAITISSIPLTLLLIYLIANAITMSL